MPALCIQLQTHQLLFWVFGSLFWLLIWFSVLVFGSICFGFLLLALVFGSQFGFWFSVLVFGSLFWCLVLVLIFGSLLWFLFLANGF